MLAFDHLVVYGESIENDIEKASKQNEVVVVKGGHHEPWGTYNYLAFMNNNSYIEWLGIEDKEKAHASDNPLIQHTAYAHQQKMEEPIQFALRTNQMDKLIHHFNKQEIPYQGPFPGSRVKPDGSTLKWRMLFPKYQMNDEILPFLIEWEGEGNQPPNEESVNEMDFSTIQVGVSDIQKASKQFEQTYRLGQPKIIHNQNEHYIAEWPLDNGRLQLVKGEGLKANFGDLVMSR
ncbi:VOC family protein [Salinibacillus xinjiangensis]|uniref:VOC family protein n=1 Tax=Salinibacillus xinjiangensis TaxID=1229268 RepID=UPI0018919854|nr:VOC family protein [Salinibacillus xinjiangensis]